MIRLSFLDSMLAAIVASHGYPHTPAMTSPIETRWANVSSFAAVGRTYLREQPQEADPAFLRRLLFNDSPPRTLGALQALIASASAKDFRNRDVVLIEGWIFSRSEARICALTNLTMSGAH